MDITISINGPQITVSIDGAEPQMVESIDQACQLLTEAAGTETLPPPEAEMPVEGQEALPNPDAAAEEASMTESFRPMR